MNGAIFTANAKWCKTNVCLSMAIIGEYKLGGLQLSLLLYIIGKYDKDKLTYNKQADGVSLSYDDIAHKLNTNKATAQKTIKKLLELKLIEKIKKATGKTKTTYLPNVSLIKNIISKYLEDCTDDKEV